MRGWAPWLAEFALIKHFVRLRQVAPLVDVTDGASRLVVCILGYNLMSTGNGVISWIVRFRLEGRKTQRSVVMVD